MRAANLIILENGDTREFISVAGIPATSADSEPAQLPASPSAQVRLWGSLVPL